MSDPLNAAGVKPAPFFEENTVWEHKEDNAWPYHVYGLVVSKQGTLLAFAEGRVEMSDHSPHHIEWLMQRDK